jgi:predicted extracellular nuclease
MKLNRFLLLLFTLAFGHLFAQSPKVAARIAFWNVENLFDTIDDPAVNDEEFLPAGKNKWTSERYNIKLDHLSKVILALGNGTGPEILGMAEVENENVVKDLTQKTGLKKQDYGIVHYDSPDKRGIDVALIYKKKSFRVLESKPVNVSIPADTFYTRDILLVKGILGKSDTIYIFVNHWPSRRGGQEASDNKRMHASNCLRAAEDSILKRFPNAQILAMGDFNDEPADKSIRALAYGQDSVCGLIDLMAPLKEQGIGSYHYKKEKNLIDHILVTRSLEKPNGYFLSEAHVFQQEWMMGENYKGDPPGPLHTYAGSRYIGGYSDHFPVYAELYLKKK